MYFTKIISFIPESDKSNKVIRRVAVRAIIIEEGKILMVRSNLGYYKLPGGGVEKDENHVEALKREVAEETGFLNCIVGEELGIISELRPDYAAVKTSFHMDSYHFRCRVNDKEKTDQSLIGYELEEGYVPVWVPVQEAIDSNTLIYAEDASKKFLLRENFALHQVKELFPVLLKQNFPDLNT